VIQAQRCEVYRGGYEELRYAAQSVYASLQKSVAVSHRLNRQRTASRKEREEFQPTYGARWRESNKRRVSGQKRLPQ
jgi:hypothetical protein